MSRSTRYVTVMVEQHKTQQTLVCDGCGLVEDVPPLGMPEGWYTVTFEQHSSHFDGWDCLLRWIHDGSSPIVPPNDALLEQLQASVEQVAERKAILAEVE